jgi:hypothetical protein
MAMRDSGGEALHRRLDSGRVGTELHAVLKARQWVGAASLINESSARFKQWGRLPLHWAAAKNAPLHIIESLLVAYPGAARVQDSCPQVPPAELAKKASIRGTIRDCAADPSRQTAWMEGTEPSTSVIGTRRSCGIVTGSEWYRPTRGCEPESQKRSNCRCVSFDPPPAHAPLAQYSCMNM